MNERPVPPTPNLTAKQEFLATWEKTRDSDDTRPVDLDACPYPGLRSFRPNEADLFYGRDAQIKDLRDLLADHNIIVVLGGSGSGKSSLVRAGLVPKLNSTAPIPERAGAWYVVEFRPKLDPVNELFDALFNQLILRVLTTHAADSGLALDETQRREFAEERARRIRALNATLNVDCPEDATDDGIQLAVRPRLREILFEGNIIDVGALFDFVDERLRSLDEALSRGATSGAPNLLLLIDQFEEVFKPKVDPAGRDMVMSLITSIHTYKPFNLFLIVTMRSEELHRCSEFLGVTEVVNSSLYLVDLIGGRNIEQAIVDPARRVLKSWDLDVGNTDTWPYTREAVSELHNVFDDARESLPHPADQLPLMQHLLPLVWDQAVGRWQSEPDGTPMQIGVKDIHAIPGWFSPNGPLIGTLNARAKNVLRRAIAAGIASNSTLNPESMEQLLRVGFCCLAQLDDRGNVVRDFATLEQMLHASGLFERSSKQQQDCKEALQRAFGVFEKATLVNVGRSYDVNHEALIRSWTTYAVWLKDARRRIDRLVAVDRAIADERKSEQASGGRVRALWTRIMDYVLVEDLARADQIAGDETSTDLQDVFGPNAAFSEQWATQAIERADAASPGSIVHTHTAAERLGSIKQTITDAVRFRGGTKYRPRVILALLVALTVSVFAGTSYFWWASNIQGDLNDQFRFFKFQSEAAAPSTDEVSRTLADDREVYAALQLASNFADKLNGRTAVGKALSRIGIDPRKVMRPVSTAMSWLGLDTSKARSPVSNTPEAISVFRTSLRQLDRNSRALLSDISIKILDNSVSGVPNPELASLPSQESQCAVADPNLPPSNLIASEPGSLGIELRTQDASGTRLVTMNAIRRGANGQIEPAASNFDAQPLVSGAMICLSRDANWFIMIRSTQGNEPPYIQRIIWIKTDRHDGWWGELRAGRAPASGQAWDNVQSLVTYYSYLSREIREGRAVVRSFRSGYRVGFLIALQNSKTAVLWTTTGVIDPDAVSTALPHELATCNFLTDPKTSRTGERERNMHCEMGPIRFDSIDHVLRADYSGCDKAPCRTELEIAYDPSGPGATRVLFQHVSSAIEAAAIWDDALWVRDANGQVWRYVVGLPALKTLTQERWKGLELDWMVKAPYSESCRAVKCDNVAIPGWPTGQRENP